MKKLSIIIPVYNEVSTISTLLDVIEQASVLGLEKEVILIDDYSTDGTRNVLKQYEDIYKVYYHKLNQGKGAALKTGFLQATGDIVLVQDADMEYDPNEYTRLISPIVEGKADVVYGSRFLGGAPHRVLYYWHSVGNKILTTTSNIFTNINLTDMETCYKVFRKDVLDLFVDKLESRRFGFEPEVTARIAKINKEGVRDCRIFEVGISYNGRTYAEGKKIGWKDGVEAFWCIIKYNVFR